MALNQTEHQSCKKNPKSNRYLSNYGLENAMHITVQYLGQPITSSGLVEVWQQQNK